MKVIRVMRFMGRMKVMRVTRILGVVMRSPLPSTKNKKPNEIHTCLGRFSVYKVVITWTTPT